MSRKRKHRTSNREDSSVPCPRCNRPMTGQYDTEAEEPIWWCEFCDRTFEVGGHEETFHMTSVIDPEGYKSVLARSWAKKQQVPS